MHLIQKVSFLTTTSTPYITSSVKKRQYVRKACIEIWFAFSASTWINNRGKKKNNLSKVDKLPFLFSMLHLAELCFSTLLQGLICEKPCRQIQLYKDLLLQHIWESLQFWSNHPYPWFLQLLLQYWMLKNSHMLSILRSISHSSD